MVAVVLGMGRIPVLKWRVRLASPREMLREASMAAPAPLARTRKTGFLDHGRPASGFSRCSHAGLHEERNLQEREGNITCSLTLVRTTAKTMGLKGLTSGFARISLQPSSHAAQPACKVHICSPLDKMPLVAEGGLVDIAGFDHVLIDCNSMIHEAVCSSPAR